MTENTLDSICGAALLMGLSRTKTAIIEFSGAATVVPKRTLAPSNSTLPATISPLSSAKLRLVEPLREVIETRLELLKGRDYVSPVEGRYWNNIGDYLAEKDPLYEGEIDGNKAKELGLYDFTIPTILVYKNAVTFPRREK